MKFNLAIPAEVERARKYFDNLIDKKFIAEVKRVSPKRSLNQNSYLHLLLNAFGLHFGYTLDEAKTVYKRDINPEIFVYEKAGSKFLRSSADLTKEEMTKSIDRLREYSAEQGYPLPTATDQGWLRELENAVEQNRYYL